MMKQKAFFMIFQGSSVARNCLSPETVPSTILGIERRFLCNFGKTFKGHIFTGKAGRALNFQLLLISKSSKLFFVFSKICQKCILDLKKRGHFFKFCLMFKVPPY